jgi:hypothetical protein
MNVLNINAIRIPTIDEMINFIDNVDALPSLADFIETVAWELAVMVREGAYAKHPVIVMESGRKAESYGRAQYIFEFWVNDMAKPLKNQYNWHLQNTSRWLYAGAICVCEKRISTHH